MSTIVTRAGKGTALTWTEMDANFTNLNNDKYQSGSNPTFGTVTATTYNQLPVFDGTSDGIVNATTPNATEFLRADGTWAVPAGVGTDLTYTAATRLLASSTGTDATLPLFSSADAGLAPASGGGTANYLRADGTWAAPAAGAGGSNTQVQYNSGGGLAGEAAFTYDAATNTLTVENISMTGSISTPLFVSATGLIGDYLSLNQPGSAPVRGWYTPSTAEMRGNIATTNILNMRYDASYSFVVGVGVVPTAWSNTVLPAYAVEIGDRASVSQFSGGLDLGWNTKVNSSYNYVARTASGTPALLQATAGTIAMKVAASNPGAGSNITFTTIATARGNSDMDLSLDCGRLKFPATQNASSDANTLDDYEEGTWVPSITAQTGTITTITFSYAAYTKIGRQVTATVVFTVTAAGTGAGSLLVTLPFTNGSYACIGSGYEGALTGNMLWNLVGASGTQMQIRNYNNTTAIASGAQIHATVTYFV